MKAPREEMSEPIPAPIARKPHAEESEQPRGQALFFASLAARLGLWVLGYGLESMREFLYATSRQPVHLALASDLTGALARASSTMHRVSSGVRKDVIAVKR